MTIRVGRALRTLALAIGSSIITSSILIGVFTRKIPKSPSVLFLLIFVLLLPSGGLHRSMREVIVDMVLVLVLSFIITAVSALSPVFLNYMGEASVIYTIAVIKWVIGQFYLLIPSTAFGLIIGFVLREHFLS